MPTGDGFWLEPRSGRLHLVSTHNDWLLDPVNQATVGLERDQVRVLAGLDPVREIDEIRMIGLLAGLVRFRDYHRKVSVQFFAEPVDVHEMLQAVVNASPRVTSDRFPVLAIQNLRDDSGVHIEVTELQAKLDAGEMVLVERDQIPENEVLRRKMDRLLEPSP